MKKTYLALALLITGFLLVGDAYGEDEVYYCAEIDSHGFQYDKERGSYRPTQFSEEKFKMKLNRASNSIELAKDSAHEILDREKYTCSIPLKSKK